MQVLEHGEGLADGGFDLEVGFGIEKFFEDFL